MCKEAGRFGRKVEDERKRAEHLEVRRTRGCDSAEHDHSKIGVVLHESKKHFRHDSQLEKTFIVNSVKT